MKTKTKSKKPVKHLGGRPTKYNNSYARIVFEFALLGLTDVQMADALQVTEKTFNNWKTSHPEFFQSINEGKASADGKVAASLFNRALGYSHPDTDIKVVNGKIVMTEVTKHYPPDTAAGIFWLKNRQKNQWRDKQELGLTDKDGEDVVTLFQLPDNNRESK